MENWSAEEIKNLRLRLGWSAADFSRHFGGPSELILSWEEGAQAPSSQDILQLNRLRFHLQSYSDQVVRDSTADRVLQEQRLSQICRSEILQHQYQN
jgi:hypothetical protein